MSNSPGMTPGGTRGTTAKCLLALALGALSACGPDAPGPPPELPGVEPGEGEWFWRDVLAAPMPGETPPRSGVLGLAPPAALLDALGELSQGGDPATLTTLLAALRHEQEAAACAAARELGTRGERAAIPRLIKSIGPFPVDYDVPIAVRAACASALARMRNPAGIPLILDLIAEGTGAEAPRASLQWEATTRVTFYQELALEGLVALAGTDFGFAPSSSVIDREASAVRARQWWADHEERLWDEAGPLTDPGLEARVRLLVAHLRTYQLRQIDGAVYTLTRLGPGVIPYLQEGLASEDDYLRLHVLDVMRGLATRVDRKTRGQLAVIAAGPLLDDPSPSVAARAARMCGAALVADPLVNALERRPEPEVRLAVVDALGATGLPTAHDVLETWAASQPRDTWPPDLKVALEAALLSTDPDRPTDRFLAMLESDPDTAYPAMERLIVLTGSDHGFDPAADPTTRTAALDKARTALADR